MVLLAWAQVLLSVALVVVTWRLAVQTKLLSAATHAMAEISASLGRLQAGTTVSNLLDQERSFLIELGREIEATKGRLRQNLPLQEQAKQAAILEDLRALAARTQNAENDQIDPS